MSSVRFENDDEWTTVTVLIQLLLIKTPLSWLIRADYPCFFSNIMLKLSPFCVETTDFVG
jgi:hypothetical protein